LVISWSPFATLVVGLRQAATRPLETGLRF
jgi:hypothetical protein